MGFLIGAGSCLPAAPEPKVLNLSLYRVDGKGNHGEVVDKAHDR